MKDRLAKYVSNYPSRWRSCLAIEVDVFGYRAVNFHIGGLRNESARKQDETIVCRERIERKSPGGAREGSLIKSARCLGEISLMKTFVRRVSGGETFSWFHGKENEHERPGANKRVIAHAIYVSVFPSTRQFSCRIYPRIFFFGETREGKNERTEQRRREEQRMRVRNLSRFMPAKVLQLKHDKNISNIARKTKMFHPRIVQCFIVVFYNYKKTQHCV